MNRLLVVDLQEEFRDQDGQFDRILDFVKRAKKTGGYDKVIATKCLNREDCAFMRYAAWDDCLQGAKPLPFAPDEVLEKYGYGLPDYGLLDPKAHYDIVGLGVQQVIVRKPVAVFFQHLVRRKGQGLCALETVVPGRIAHEGAVLPVQAFGGDDLVIAARFFGVPDKVQDPLKLPVRIPKFLLEIHHK